MIGKARKLSAVVTSALAGLVLSGCVTQSEPPVHNHPVDFSGFWEMGDKNFEDVVRPENDVENLTDEAKARLAEFRKRFPEAQSKWPMDLCMMHGMPWTMLTRARTYATEIVQTQNRIFVIHEGFDQVRDIHLDKTEVPSNFGPSNQGYSVARFEGNELVIETGGLIGFNDYSDLQRSDDARVIERWRFVEGENGEQLLETELYVTDPAVYKKPAHGKKHWIRMPEGTVVSGYNCNNTMWDDFVADELIKQEEAEAAH